MAYKTKHESTCKLLGGSAPFFGYNAVIESFFKTLKTEVVYQLKKQVEADKMNWIISEFIGYYNHGHRPHSTNNYLSPNQFEKIRLDEVALIEQSLGTK